ncbi:MAG: efflux RND transporter periplasmic adaptor subunit [Roseiflexaceae bacterium]
MHQRLRIVVPIVGLAVIAVITGFWWQTRSASSSDGSLKASGTIEAEQVLITSEISGRIKLLLADEGQEVAANAPLAQIDTALLEAQHEQAQAAVALAEANLALLQAGARSEEIAAAEAALAQAQASRDGALAAVENAATLVADPQDLQIQIAQAQASRDAAQAALRKLKAGSRPEDIATAEAAAAQAEINLQATREKLSATKTQAEAAMQQAVTALTQAQARYAQAKFNWEYIRSSDEDPAQPDINPNTAKETVNDASAGQAERYYAEFVQAEAAMHGAEQQVQIATIAYDAARQAEVTGIAAAEQQLKAAQAGLAKLRNGPTREDLAQAETALASAQRTLDTLLTIRENPHQLAAASDNAQAQLAIAEANLAAAEARLDQLRNGARPEQIQAAQAQLAQANASLHQIDVQLAKAAMQAPRAGIILSRPVHEGEQVVPGAPVMTIGSLDTVRLVLYIAESDIGKIRQGQQVDVTVDSFPGQIFPGTISFIAQEAEFTPRNVQTQAERVTTVFAVRVDLNNPDHRLKPGMPADAVLR